MAQPTLYSDADIAKLLVRDSEAYQSSHSRLRSTILDGKALKTNKRFLKSVIRNANDHNRLLDRKPDRLSTPASRLPEEDRMDRDRHSHRSTTHHHTHTGSSRGTERGNRAHRRTWSSLSSSSSSSEVKHSRRSREEEYYSRASRRVEHTRSHAHSSTREIRKRSAAIDGMEDGDPREAERHSDKHKERRRERDRDRHQDWDGNHAGSSRSSKPSIRKTSATHEEQDHHASTANNNDDERLLPRASKMDKYFCAGYDPRLDVDLDAVTDAKTGLIEGGNYDDWESILAQMKAKREHKAREKETRLQEKLAAAERKLRNEEKKERKYEKKKRRRRNRDGARSASDTDDDDDDDREGQELDEARRKRKRREKRKKREAADRTSSAPRSKRRFEGGGECADEGERKRAKKHSRKPGPSSDSDCESSDCSSDPPHRTSAAPLTRNTQPSLIHFNRYSKPGKPREWDLGKASPT
ncbi:hypothetical protein PCANC_23868 [Puccinia coronata f. sp. avenae]|uniref:Uncharacterized protein n=1 Tax=Puccinia coronata f. sp. avenae TaxID=200324 RepID=A0A2N5S235_9BASI|nr:hypothetical protein PCANC_23868 [Puccinia coronata f. sp. avenae]